MGHRSVERAEFKANILPMFLPFGFFFSADPCLIVGHHHLTDDFFPATVIFGSPFTVNFVHCLMLSMYCFRGPPQLRLPSTYPSTSFSNLMAMISAEVSKLLSVVRDLRAIYRPFGSTSSKRAKIGTYVHNSILFRFLPGVKSGDP